MAIELDGDRRRNPSFATIATACHARASCHARDCWSRPLAKILILTFGSRGDVQPYVALGAALKARGHAVTLSTSPTFDDLIGRFGLAPAPLSVDVQDMMRMPEVKAAMASVRGWLKAFRVTQDLMRRQLDDMWTVARDVAPDIIVYHPKAFVAPYLARALGAVAIPSFLQPAYVPTGAFPFPLLSLPTLGAIGNRLSGQVMTALMRFGYDRLLRQWLPRHGEIAARPWLDALSGYHPAGAVVPRLHAHSAHLVPKPGDWTARDHITGYWFLPRDDAWQPPADLAAFLSAGPPPVYVGFGSMPDVDDGRAAATVIAALGCLKRRAVMARGWGALADAAASDHIHIIDQAPHDGLFPRCAGVMHHGGAGTTHEGLRWGRPSLICPVFGDQPFWGRVVAGTGAGPAPLPLRRLTEDGVAAALAALASDAVRAAAERVGAGIRAERGADLAAEIVEAEIVERRVVD